MHSLGDNLLYGAAYTGIGFSLLVIAFFVLDYLTPGKLSAVMSTSHSAALIASANLIGLGLIIFTAIWFNATNGFGTALEYTAAFGGMGIGLQALSFVVWDLLTPGKLGDIVCVPGEAVPLAKLVAAGQLAASFIIVASIA